MTSRDFSIDVIKRLQAAGFTALWAGGCVRDSLLGRPPKDYDVATNATPDQVRKLFGYKRTLAIGASFGVISVLGPKGVEPIEVATFRRDGGYSDGRRPDSVEFTDAREDALRRDFTINGMFYDPLTEQVLDYVGGQRDLEAKVIRSIGDPVRRIDEDRLRMLRGIRFAAIYGMSIEPATMAAIQHQADKISVVSGERIGSELTLMLTHPNKAIAARLLVDSTLLNYLLPDLASVKVENVSDVGVSQLERLSNDDFESAVVAWLEPALGNGGDVEQAKKFASTIQLAWRLTNDQKSTVAWIGGHWRTMHRADGQPWPMIQRLLIHESASKAVAVAAAIDGESDGLAFCRERLRWPAERLNPPPLLDGQALIAKGIKPGPQFKQILDEVRDAQLNGDIDCSEAATQLALRLLKQKS